MTLKRLLVTCSHSCSSADRCSRGRAAGLDPAELLKPLGDSWPTYSGDYSGKRYSPLTQIDQRR